MQDDISHPVKMLLIEVDLGSMLSYAMSYINRSTHIEREHYPFRYPEVVAVSRSKDHGDEQ